MKKKMVSLLLAAVLAVGICPAAFAAEEQPMYAITDEAVIIDYVEYKIIDGKIQYNGWTYDVDGDVLVRYDDKGPIYLVLPTEQNRITDPERIAELNAAIGKADPLSREIPSNPVNLPYTASVPEGATMTVTPAFNIVPSRFANVLTLTLNDLPLFSSKEFLIYFMRCDAFGTWTEEKRECNFILTNFTRFDVFSNMRYGRFVITDLKNNPTPAYTYEIKLSAA